MAYGMSGVGNCPRVLSAEQIGGFDPAPQTPDDIERLNYYTSLEAVAANQLAALGYTLEDAGLCLSCKEKYGIERHGIHVEIKTALFDLMGHLDRRIHVNGRILPVEIKSLGPGSYEKFRRNQFQDFSNYEYQERCYLEAEQSPGLYWIMNRDTGECLSYLVNNDGTIDLNDLPPNTLEITLGLTFDNIVDKLNEVEICVQDSVLAEGEAGDGCWFCRYKYLCAKKEPTAKIVKDPAIIQAALQYKDATVTIKIAEEEKSSARATLLMHAKTATPKFKVFGCGLSASYRGQTTKTSLDATVIKNNVSPEILRLATRESQPYDAFTIRTVKD